MNTTKLRTKIAQKLFEGFAGCPNGDCIIRDNSTGMRTNGSCSCLHNLSRAQLNILKSRIKMLDSHDVEDPLAALAAVMQHHGLELFLSADGSGLLTPNMSINDSKGRELFQFSGFGSITADDIKLEAAR